MLIVYIYGPGSLQIFTFCLDLPVHYHWILAEESLVVCDKIAILELQVSPWQDTLEQEPLEQEALEQKKKPYKMDKEYVVSPKNTHVCSGYMKHNFKIWNVFQRIIFAAANTIITTHYCGV